MNTSRNNLSRNSSIPVLGSPIPNSNNSFRRLGNSIISPNSINSFTVKKIKENSISQSPQLFDTPRLRHSETKSEIIEKSALKHIQREKNPSYPPGELKYSVFAIYENGNSYDVRKRSYGMPKGMGILINEHLCITAGSVFPDESSAINSFIQLKDGSSFRFDPYRAFVTIQEQFSIIAFRMAEAKVLQKFKPLDLKYPFELMENDPVFYFPLDTNHDKNVLIISQEYFTISSGKPEFILPGNPIFTVDWKLQGIFVSSDKHVNKVLKIYPILEYLEGSIPLLHNPILEKFLNQDKPGYIEKFHDRHLYYFE